MMHTPLTADARRFHLSLAASAFLNMGLLILIGWLDRPVVSRPQARPHLRMVTLSRRPAPPSSAHRGVAAGLSLTTSSLPLPQNAPRRRVRHRPPVREVAVPWLPLFIVTTTRASARALPRPVRPIPALPVPSSPPSPGAAAPPTPALPAPPIPAVPVPAAKGRAPVRHEASRGETGGGAGWAGDAGTETNQKAGGPFGIGDGLAASGTQRHIVYVLDISGSMKSRMDRAEDELRQALSGLRPGETFNIVAFSGGSSLFDPDMAEATPGAVQRASAFLGGLEADRATDLEDAVVRALMLRDVNEVVILTDGVPTVGETDPEKLVQAVRRFNLHHARISTIGLVGRNADGTDSSFAAAHLLQQIARDSGGTSKLVTVGVASP